MIEHCNPKIRLVYYNSLIWQFGTVNFISYILLGYSLRPCREQADVFFGLSVGYPGVNLEVLFKSMFEPSLFRRKHKANRKVNVQLSPVSIRPIDLTVKILHRTRAILLGRGRKDEDGRKWVFFD